MSATLCSRIKGLYRRYKDPTDSPQQRQLLAYQLLRELTVHMLAEEQVGLVGAVTLICYD